MTPLPCEGCFLYERTGAACPPARRLFGLDSAQAEQLRRAVVQDAANTPSLAELLAGDVTAGALDRAPQMPRALLSAPESLSNNQKEAIHAVTRP